MTTSCEHVESVSLWLLRALPPEEAAAVEEHVVTCSICSAELEALQPTIDAMVEWPTDVLRPSRPLWDRLAERIPEVGEQPPAEPLAFARAEPAWEQVAPGIECKLLAAAEDRVSMLVRLAPGASYPPHRHAGVEELHLLDGELWIDERLLHPGDYNLGDPGGVDHRVWSETGCTCVLITSPNDVLG